MSTLKEKADEILAEKEAKILPENIKHGVTVFGVTGTYGGSEPEYNWVYIDEGEYSVDPINSNNTLHCYIYHNEGTGTLKCKVIFEANEFNNANRMATIKLYMSEKWYLDTALEENASEYTTLHTSDTIEFYAVSPDTITSFSDIDMEFDRADTVWSTATGPVWELLQGNLECNTDPDNSDNKLYCNIYTNTGSGNAISKVEFYTSIFDSEDRYVDVFTDVGNCWSHQEDMSYLLPISTVVATLYSSSSCSAIYSSLDASEFINGGISQYTTYEWADMEVDYDWEINTSVTFDDPDDNTNSIVIEGYDNFGVAEARQKLVISSSFSDSYRYCDIDLGNTYTWYWDEGLTDLISSNTVSLQIDDCFEIYTGSEDIIIGEYLQNFSENLSWWSDEEYTWDIMEATTTFATDPDNSNNVINSIIYTNSGYGELTTFVDFNFIEPEYGGRYVVISLSDPQSEDVWYEDEEMTMQVTFPYTMYGNGEYMFYTYSMEAESLIDGQLNNYFTIDSWGNDE